MNGHSRNDDSRAAMDDPLLQERTEQQQPGSSIRILGQGGANNLFKKSIDQTRQQSQQQSTPNSSIFSRVSVPDPRAQEFIPSELLQSQQINLLSRLDPMVPVNSLPSNEVAATVTTHDSSFPLQPTDVSLCRYSLGCTNPMCSFSHPSASAVSQSKKTGGNEPLVLKQEPCRFQKDCTNAECTFSHISPAVTFILAKGGKSGSEAISTVKIGGPIACHYQLQCKNPTCTFVHYDPQSGQVTPTPALSRQDSSFNKLDQALSSEIKPCRFGLDCTRKECHFAHPPERNTHISNRLARFDDNRFDGEMEVIIPAN